MKTPEHNVIEVVEFCREHSFDAELVGRWVWVSFDAKPSAAIRQALKDFGFRWSPRRSKWAHNCGHPCRAGHGDPRVKYGHRAVTKVDTEQLQVA